MTATGTATLDGQPALLQTGDGYQPNPGVR